MSWLDELRKMKERSGMTTNQIASASKIPEPTLEKLFAGKTKSPGIGAVQTLVLKVGGSSPFGRATRKSPESLDFQALSGLFFFL